MITRYGRVAQILWVILSVLWLTGCAERMATSISDNSTVKTKMEQHLKDKYNLDIPIEHTIKFIEDNGSREYLAEFVVDGKSYIVNGEYNSDGSYRGTNDTIINTVVNKYETERVGKILQEVFEEYYFKVDTDIRCDEKAEFNGIPAYRNIANSGYLQSGSAEVIVGIVYESKENIKSEYKGKMEVLQDILNDDISTSVAFYLIDKDNKRDIEEYLKDNDIDCLIDVFNSSTDYGNDIDCCDSAIKFTSSSFDVLKDREMHEYIVDLTKDKES